MTLVEFSGAAEPFRISTSGQGPGAVVVLTGTVTLESCSGRAFQECVALPLWAALRDTTPPPMPGASLASTIPATSTDRTHSSPRTAPLTSRLGHWLSTNARGTN